jgi:hypothetical protein
MAITTGLPQQQPLHTFAGVRSAPSQQHGAHMWRSATTGPAPVPDEEKSFGAPLKR